jgi:hypothetical protein
MEEKIEFFRRVDDLRGYWDEYPDVRQWRIALRKKLYTQRLFSDLTLRPIHEGFAMHEGLFSRRWVGKQSWQELIMAGPNCFLILDSEHIPESPNRTICYWLSVCRYGQNTVDRWIASLPWKAAPDKPWRGSHGLTIIQEVPNKWRVSPNWIQWFENNKLKLDKEAE